MKTIITPESSRKLNLKELIHYKDLFFILAIRDLRVRYAQTALGLLWALLQPLATLLIFTLIFGRAIKVDTGSIPYPVYAMSGMSAWAYFSFVLSQSGGSIISAGDMVKKIYFPRLVIPLSKALVAVVDFLITLSILIALMVFYQVPISQNLVFLPLFFLLNVIGALGVGIWLSALTIRYRDFQHVVPFLVQIGLYATPIAYPASLVPEKYQWLYHLNPMTGIISGFRWSLFGEEGFHPMTFISFTMIFVLFISGVWYFKRMEKTMADLV
ncbi:MAG: lipopolysaccharide transport system permease protein [Cyclobacteriaceae bacterium]|jgi:lipopolysaccharide transport system permease protein